MLLQGIFPAITTPFYPDGKLYLKKLEHNVDLYSKTPIAGLVVLGSTGEAVMLSDEEKRQVLNISAEVAAPHKVLLAGTGCESAIETISLCEFAAKLGYDCALVRTPHYYRPQMLPENILAFYRTVADHSPLPVVLYSVPVYTNYDLPVKVIVELADHPNIIGLKESSGNLQKVAALIRATTHVKRKVPVTDVFEAVTGRMLRQGAGGNGAGAPQPANNFVSVTQVASAVPSTGPLTDQRSAPPVEAAPSPIAIPAKSSFKARTRAVGFQVLTGLAQTLHASLAAGASGAVLAFAAPAPTACFEILTAWKEGDSELAIIKQQRIAAAAQQIGGEFGISGLKYAMDLNGYYGGPARLPLLPPTAEIKRQIEDLMSDIKN